MSNDAVPPVDEVSPASKEENDWVGNIEAKLKEIKLEIPPEKPEIKNNIPSIYGNWKCSFHELDFLPETIRWQFAALMKRSFNLNVRSFHKKFQQIEDDVWRCYEGADKQFIAANIENLLANSCFLIYAMVILNEETIWKLNAILYRSDDNAKDQRIKESKYLEKFIFSKRKEIERYVLTMDNQIPLIVVKAVYTNCNLSSELNTPIHELAISFLKGINPGVHKSKLLKTPIHKLAISFFKGINPEVHKSKLHITDNTKDRFQHLLHIFHWSRTPEEKFHKIDEWFPMKMDSFYIPSATGLQLSGTVFEKHAASGIDVSFCKAILSGVMKLPHRSHFQYKDEIYKQLLAFEKGYGTVCGFSVTAHIACILCLAKTEEDVKLLRAKHIIPRIEDNKDVLSSLEWYKTRVLSNDIPMSAGLIKLMKDVKSHHDKNTGIKKWCTDFKRRYCSNPWITISVVGGIILFVLTFIQTIYSALSYNKQ